MNPVPCGWCPNAPESNPDCPTHGKRRASPVPSPLGAAEHVLARMTPGHVVTEAEAHTLGRVLAQMQADRVPSPSPEDAEYALLREYERRKLAYSNAIYSRLAWEADKSTVEVTSEAVDAAECWLDEWVTRLLRLRATSVPPRRMGEGETHWEGCWRERGHHECAVHEIERLASVPAAPRDGAHEDPLVPCYHCGRMVDELSCVDSDEEGM